MAQKFTDVQSAVTTNRLQNLDTHSAIHLSDGTCVYAVTDGTTYLLKHTGADHATVTTIATLLATTFATTIDISIACDSNDNLYVAGGLAAANMRVQAFTKGAGYSWTAQTALVATTGAQSTNDIDVVWCNTGGGTSSAGHLLVIGDAGASGASIAPRYWICDAGAALAGSGTLVTNTGTNPAFIKTTNAICNNYTLSPDGFGATHGLLAFGDGTSNNLRVGSWAISSAGALTTNANVGTTTDASAANKTMLIRYASDRWAAVVSATTSGYYVSRWSSTARLTASTAGLPTNMPSASGNSAYEAFLDTSTADKIWIISTGTLSGTNLPVWRCGVTLTSGVTFDAAATADDTLTNINTNGGVLRCVREPRGGKSDWQTSQKISTTDFALLGDWSLKDTYSGTSSLAGSSSVSSTASINRVAAAGLTGAGVVAAAGTTTRFAGGSLAGGGVTTASGNAGRFATAGLAGVGVLAGAGIPERFTMSALTGNGALAAAAFAERFAVSGQAGAGALAASASIVRFALAALSGAGSLEGTSSPMTRSASADLVGTGELVALVSFVVLANLIGSGSLAGTATIDRQAVAALLGAGDVTGTGSVLRDALADLVGAGALTAAGMALRSALADLTASGALSATGTRTAMAIASLVGAGSIDGVSDIERWAYADLSADALIEGLAELFVLRADLLGSGSITADGVTTRFAEADIVASCFLSCDFSKGVRAASLPTTVTRVGVRP